MCSSRRFAQILLPLVAVLAFRIQAQPLGPNLTAKLDDLIASYWQPNVTAAFGTFTYGYTDLPSPFSRWLEDELASAVSKSGNLRLFNRSAAAAMDQSLKAVYGDFFAKNGVDALLAGRFTIDGSTVRTRLELTGLSDGILIGTADLRVQLSAVPPGLEIEPAQAVKNQVSSLTGIIPRPVPANGVLLLSASTDRGPSAVYRDGENLTVFVTVNQPAFLRMYHIDVNAKVQRIWPNRFGGGIGRVVMGEIVHVPGAGDPFRFRMEPPYGTEFIKVVASTQPFDRDDADFADLVGDARSSLTRGLSMQSDTTAVLYAEALISYVIVPAN
ncbi:MAG: DUF4384 domain-containing protein [Chthoniobacterales bacterium]